MAQQPGQGMDAAGDELALRIEPEAGHGDLLTLTRENDLAGEQLPAAGGASGPGADGDLDGYRGRAGCRPIEVQVHAVLAARCAARVGGLAVERGGVTASAEVVAQQVEDGATAVRAADRPIARRLDPQIDIGVAAVGATDLDQHVARWDRRLALPRARRCQVRQAQHDDRDEAGQRQHDDVAEQRALDVVLEGLKRLHRAPPVPSAPRSAARRRPRAGDRRSSARC
jgi:hypothetical protein